MMEQHTTFDLFVYGTLRSRHDANAVLQGCERRGTGVVHGIMYDIDGRFPASILYGDTPIHGEVWRCPSSLLLQLDQYEGVGSGLFRRVATVALMDDGEEAPCWIYTAGPALSRRLTPSARIEGGRYTPKSGDDDVE